MLSKQNEPLNFVRFLIWC